MARYFRSTPQDFISQFVPENLALQQGYFDNLQGNQDAFQKEITGLNTKSNALPNDIPLVVQQKKAIEDKVNSMAAYNINDPNQRKQALQGIVEARQAMSPFGVLGAPDDKKKRYDAFEKELYERYKANPMMLSYMDKKLKENNLNPDRAIKFDSNGNPLNTEIIPPKEFTYKDLNNELSSLLKDEQFDQIAHGLGLSKEQGHEALYSFTHGNTKELRGAKIYNDLKNRVLADGNLVESIKADANYFLGDEAKASQILEQALQGVSSAGSFKRTELNKTLHEDSVESYRAKKKADVEELNITTSSQSEGLPGSVVKLPTELEDLEFNSDGSFKAVKTTNKEVVGLAGSNLKTPSGSSILYKSGQPDLEANKRISELISSLKVQHPELSKLKDNQVVEAYKNSIKALESESIPLETITGVAAENIGKSLARNKTQRNFYLYDGKGKTIDGQLSTVLDELDIDETDFDKALSNGIGGYTQAGPSAGSYYVEVPDSDGKARRVMISPDTEMSNIFRTSQMVNEARKTLTPTEIKPMENIPNYSIIVKPNIKADGTPTWEYIEVIKDNSGRIIKQNPTSLDDLRETEREHLRNSNYIGSQVGVLKPNTTQ